MFKVLITAAALVAASPALAVAQVSTPISLTAASINTSVTTSYNGFVDEGLVAGLTASTIFTLRSISGDKKAWSFDLTLANTSSGAITASRVSIFGFDVSPELSGATGAGIFSVVGRNANVPQIGPLLDICFRAGGGGSGCASGGGGGVEIGETYATGSFVLRFVQATEALLLDNFFVRYQSIAGTDRGTSGVGVDDLQSDGNGSVVPEPATWAMLVIGFGAVGAVRRRRRGVMTTA